MKLKDKGDDRLGISVGTEKEVKTFSLICRSAKKKAIILRKTKCFNKLEVNEKMDISE